MTDRCPLIAVVIAEAEFTAALAVPLLVAVACEIAIAIAEPDDAVADPHAQPLPGPDTDLLAVISWHAGRNSTLRCCDREI